jgi:GTPase involved in cell partitioning and DNA repair
MRHGRLPRRAGDPVADYCVVRRELALYNPEYCARPHVVALNKLDLLPAAHGAGLAPAPDAAALVDDILAAAQALQARLHLRAAPGAAAALGASAAERIA